MYVFHTFFPSGFRTLWFHPRKKFWTAQNLLNGWKFRCLPMSICNIYEQQTVHVRYHSLNVCGILSLDILSTHIRCPWKRREEGKIRYMERLYIVSSMDIEKCKRMHLVIIVCIPCVYVRLTWYKLPIFICLTSSLHDRWTQSVCKKDTADDQSFRLGAIRIIRRSKNQQNCWKYAKTKWKRTDKGSI